VKLTARGALPDVGLAAPLALNGVVGVDEGEGEGVDVGEGVGVGEGDGEGEPEPLIDCELIDCTAATLPGWLIICAPR